MLGVFFSDLVCGVAVKARGRLQVDGGIRGDIAEALDRDAGVDHHFVAEGSRGQKGRVRHSDRTLALELIVGFAVSGGECSICIAKVKPSRRLSGANQLREESTCALLSRHPRASKGRRSFPRLSIHAQLPGKLVIILFGRFLPGHRSLILPLYLVQLVQSLELLLDQVFELLEDR